MILAWFQEWPYCKLFDVGASPFDNHRTQPYRAIPSIVIRPLHCKLLFLSERIQIYMNPGRIRIYPFGRPTSFSAVVIHVVMKLIGFAHHQLFHQVLPRTNNWWAQTYFLFWNQTRFKPECATQPLSHHLAFINCILQEIAIDGQLNTTTQWWVTRMYKHTGVHYGLSSPKVNCTLSLVTVGTNRGHTSGFIH